MINLWNTKKLLPFLKGLVEKHPLVAAEKEAAMTTIGVLAWGVLGKSKTRVIKAKRDRRTDW